MVKDKKVITLTVLSALAVFSLIYGVTAPAPGRRRAVPKDSHVPVNDRFVNARGIVPTSRRASRTEYTSWGRSPFVLEKAAKTQVLTLSGILWDDVNPQAVINDTIVGAGDSVGLKNTVVEIRTSSVILNDGTKNFELTY